MDAYGKTTLSSSDVFWLTLQQIHQTLPEMTFLSLPSCQEVFDNVQSTFGCSNVNRFSWQFHSLVRNGTASKLWRPQRIHRTWEELARKYKSICFVFFLVPAWCLQNGLKVSFGCIKIWDDPIWSKATDSWFSKGAMKKTYMFIGIPANELRYSMWKKTVIPL